MDSFDVATSNKRLDTNLDFFLVLEFLHGPAALLANLTQYLLLSKSCKAHHCRFCDMISFCSWCWSGISNQLIIDIANVTGKGKFHNPKITVGNQIVY